MGFLSLFKRTNTPDPVVFLLSYAFCYQGLPRIFFANPPVVISTLQKDGAVALQTYVSTFLDEYVKAMPAARSHIPGDFASLFSVETRQVDAKLGALLITHPRPPQNPVELQPGKLILAPYFTAIVFDPTALIKPAIFVLGQNPTGGTTLRSVSGENSHGNCGTGCDANLEDFLSLVIVVQRDGIQAAWKKYPPV
jgi:hypothetical protein